MTPFPKVGRLCKLCKAGFNYYILKKRVDKQKMVSFILIYGCGPSDLMGFFHCRFYFIYCYLNGSFVYIFRLRYLG